jgi:hypothetical protein
VRDELEIMRKWSRPNFKVLSRHLPVGTKEIHKQFSQDNRSPGRDFNPGPPECEAGLLSTRPEIQSVGLSFNYFHQWESIYHDEELITQLE